MNKKEYNYIWYLLTCFVEKEKNTMNFQIAKKISPYLELNLENLTNIECEINSEPIVNVDVNPFLRFNHIFNYIIDPDAETLDVNVKNLMSNIMLHLLGNVDLYLGQCKKDIIVKKLVSDIEKGCMGKQFAKKFELFKRYEKMLVGDVLYRMYYNLDMLEAFKKIIKLLYQDSIIYDNRYSYTNIVLYLNYKEEENKERIEFLKDMFLPIGLEIDIFWEKHFGVIDVPVTMVLGEIAIF
jgi:hypothetical protein